MKTLKKSTVRQWEQRLLVYLFTLALLHSPIFEGGFLNVGASANKMGNSHETREIKSLMLTHSFLYFTLVRKSTVNVIYHLHEEMLLDRKKG